MAKTIFIVRHGEAESNVGKYFDGCGSSRLTPLGRAQASVLRKRLAKEGIGRVFCSDLPRTRETLSCLKLDAPVTYSKALREKNYGKFEGVVWGDDEGRFERQHLDPYVRPPGGETASEVQSRAWNYISSTVFTAKEEKVLVVSHHGPIVLFTCRLLGMPLIKWRQLRLGNCGLCILTNDDHVWRLKLWNSLSHYGLLNFTPLLTREAKVPVRKK